VAEIADAVVIGSALVDRLDRCESVEQAVAAVSDFLGPVREAMDARRNTDEARTAVI